MSGATGIPTARHTRSTRRRGLLAKDKQTFIQESHTSFQINFCSGFEKVVQILGFLAQGIRAFRSDCRDVVDRRKGLAVSSTT